MSKRLVYIPLGRLFFILLSALLGVIVVVSLLFGIDTAFSRLGFGRGGTAIILVSSLLGSSVNIPIGKLETRLPTISVAYVKVFGIIYPVPTVGEEVTKTVVAVNLGGAIIPLIVSLYILTLHPTLIFPSLMALVAVAFLVYLIARPIVGVGIVTPFFIPPMIAALTAIMITEGFYPSTAAVAYIAGTLGTLIGADILKLKVIPRLGAPVASIGGAGAFDGIFLTGIIAVLLV